MASIEVVTFRNGLYASRRYSCCREYDKKCCIFCYINMYW